MNPKFNINKTNLLYTNKFIDNKINNKIKPNNEDDEIQIPSTSKERITLINIDSRNRNKVSKNIYDQNLYTLNQNAFQFTNMSNKLIINLNNHGFKLNDKIIMQNVVGQTTTIKHKLYLKNNSAYIKIIDETHNMTYNYNNKNLFVNISGVVGKVLINSLNAIINEIGGISIELINKNHIILFNVLESEKDSTDVNNYDAMADDIDIKILNDDIKTIRNMNINELSDINYFDTKVRTLITTGLNPLDNSITNLEQVINKLIPNFFLIKLNIKASEDYIPDINNSINLENKNVKLGYLFLYGIPLYYLNANFPLNINRNIDHHLITKVINRNNFEIQLKQVALEQKYDPFKPEIYGQYIEIAKIINVIQGYPNPNSYKIFLNTTYTNVSRVELISTIFPNTEKIFKNTPTSKQNTKLYWNILGDGIIEYSIDILPGNYSPQSLIYEIESQINSVKRNDKVYLDKITRIRTDPVLLDQKSDVNINFPLFYFKDYERNTIIKTSINIYTDIVSFSAFDRIYLKNAIGNFTDPSISPNSSDISSSYFVVFHPFHPYTNLDINKVSIIIDGSTNLANFPASSINGEHLILAIIDQHRYKVSHNRTTVLLNPNDIKTNDNIVITFPIYFRMLFNRPNTMGKELGFNNVGIETSVTPFAYKIKNTDYYDQFINYNNIKQIEKPHNVLSFSGDSYILITNKLFSNYVNTGAVKDIFALIKLIATPNSLVFDTFIHNPIIFSKVIDSISELEFEFYSPDGELYEFNGLDHSFCLRIYETINIAADTHFSSKTGKQLQLYAEKNTFTGSVF
jgi:hypothetical protein